MWCPWMTIRKDSAGGTFALPLTAPPSVATRANVAGPGRLAVLALALGATLGGLFGGPALGDHEAIVAQCARNMRLTGDWLVPQFLDTPFLRKPPLPSWLTAACSFVLPNDRATGLPVTAAAARLPSALAGLGVVLLLWRLASAMFNRRVGRAAAVLASASVAILLYAVNATAEMLLTFGCTWAYYHFWFATTGRPGGRRLIHLLLFYVALGVAMLAKGPAPIAMVVMPLVVWWYLGAPARVLARGGPGAVARSLGWFVRALPRRTLEVFTRLWVLPGVLIFLGVFVPWIIAVGHEHPHAWSLWNWQYVQRIEGHYEDTRVRGPFYYVPVVLGLAAPWTLSLFEALLAPWLRRYRRLRKGLWYAAAWGVGGVVVMSLMEFKKPYYILPALPGLLLMLAVVTDRFFAATPRSTRRAWLAWGALAVGLAAGVAGGHLWLRRHVPTSAEALTLVGAVGALVFLAAGVLHIHGRGGLAMAAVALTVVVGFHVVWYGQATRLDNLDKVAALARALDSAGVPRDARVIWTDQRPDARLSFYFNRRSEHLIPPAEIVTRMVDRTGQDASLEQIAAERAQALLANPTPVYLILDRHHLDRHQRWIAASGRELTSVQIGPGSSTEDWVVVTNVD